MQYGRKNGGFTFIEVLIAAAVIAILASIVYASLGDARKKAHDTARISDLHQIQIALRIYKDQNGSYPSYGGAVKIGEGSQIDTDLKEYLPQVPHDPRGPGSADFYYAYDDTRSCPDAGGSVAMIWANAMERDADGNYRSVCDSAGQASSYALILK